MSRIRDLDGLRGLAALAVLLAHLFGEPAHGFKGLSLGWLGVSVFFALSGYLIGGIILDDIGKPGFFRSFFTRRAARITPIYLAVVGLTLAALAAASGTVWADATLHPAAYLTFTTNIVIALGADGGHWLLPTWTLAVEEQFYLLLPLLIALAPRRWLPLILLLLCAGSVVFRAVLFPLQAEAAGMLLPGRWDTLLYGVLAAWLQRNTDLRPRLGVLRIIVLGAVAALVAVLATGSYGLTVIASPALVGVASAGLILLAALGQSDMRFARTPVLVWFGSISYGLYLVHQPINGLLHGLILGSRPDVGSAPQLAVTALAAGASILLAWISWTRFEKPIMDLARRFEARRPGARAATPAVEAAGETPAG